MFRSVHVSEAELPEQNLEIEGETIRQKHKELYWAIVRLELASANVSATVSVFGSYREFEERD